MKKLLLGAALLGLMAPLAASQVQRIELFELDVLCTRRLFYPAENLLLTETVACPADLALCDRVEALADGTVVSGCPGSYIVTTRTLPDAACGQPHLAWFSSVDGVPPYTYEQMPTISSGIPTSLPPGLTFNSNGSITGTVPWSAPDCQTGSGMVAMNPRAILYGD